MRPPCFGYGHPAGASDEHGDGPYGDGHERRRGRRSDRGGDGADAGSRAQRDEPALEEILRALAAARDGDLSVRLPVRRRDLVGEIQQATNELVALTARLTTELARVGRIVGRDGRVSERMTLGPVDGAWAAAVESVNGLVEDLARPTAEVSRVVGAVAAGDLTQTMAAADGDRPVKGEFAAIARTVDGMVAQLSLFADEVTRVARAVGTEGRLGGQATVEGVRGTWRDLTDNVNSMASNLTDQVRQIAAVTSAVAGGDLTRKVTVDAKGEIATLADTINAMTDQLGSFAAEVTRVAREVGTEGRLGGQARVDGVGGTWRDLTENVNQLAGNLTTQVRAIAEVSTAVTQGDLSRQIDVAAQGEVAELSSTINQMIANLAETTRRNAEQDWLSANLARISGLMQGQRDPRDGRADDHVGGLPARDRAARRVLPRRAGRGRRARAGARRQLRLPAANDRRRPLQARRGARRPGGARGRVHPRLRAAADYVKVASGLGEAVPAAIVVLPVLFEERVLAVVELASLRAFAPSTMRSSSSWRGRSGSCSTTIVANRRTEELLEQSQRLTEELQTQSEELQAQQEELRRTNAELEQQARSLRASEELLQTQQEELRQTNEELQEKAALLAQQNRDIEIKNAEIELAPRAALEEKAGQLALSSRYK